MAEKLITFRDLARSDEKVFNQYKAKKLEKMDKEVVSKEEFINYKIEKGKIAAGALENIKENK